MKYKRNYDIEWNFSKIYNFDIYEDLQDFMKKNKFYNYFVVGGENPHKKYLIFGKRKKNLKNLILFLTNRGK